MKTVHKIFSALADAGGKPFLVGGSVRDKFLGIDAHDYDCEVFNMSPEKLGEILETFGRVDRVGSSFGIFKLRVGDDEFDFSVPRRESKSGKGHKGFIPELDPTMTVREAAARRDFTVNSMAISHKGEVFDFFNGAEDLQKKILRHTSPAFSEDPLRVLRGMQFAGRFNMKMAFSTANLCHTMRHEYCTLPYERIWGEWHKWAAKSVTPSAGLRILLGTGWIFCYPELAKLEFCKQDPEWHPEGNVWEHTLHVVDAAADIAIRDGLNEFDRTVLVFAGLCHDLAKPRTTTFEDGHVRSRGHASEGVTETESFLARIGCQQHARAIVDQVVPLVREHLSHLNVQPGNDRSIRRLAARLAPATIAQWVRVVEADHSGRPPLPKGSPAMWVLERATELNIVNNRPAEILMGRHLIEDGMSPGPLFGKILKQAYEAQLDGVFTDLEGALVWLALGDHEGNKNGV